MKALGMIEVYGYLAAVEALDSALKAANVSLLDVTLVKGGLVTVLVTGDVGAVKAAMDASKSAAGRVGTVVSVHVIPRPSKDIEKMIHPHTLYAPGAPKKLENITPSTSCEPKSENSVANERSEMAETEKKEAKNSHIDLKTITPEMLKEMTVEKLRSFARKIKITNMTSNQIRFAIKNELIRSITEFIEQER